MLCKEQQQVQLLLLLTAALHRPVSRTSDSQQSFEQLQVNQLTGSPLQPEKAIAEPAVTAQYPAQNCVTWQVLPANLLSVPLHSGLCNNTRATAAMHCRMTVTSVLACCQPTKVNTLATSTPPWQQQRHCLLATVLSASARGIRHATTHNIEAPETFAGEYLYRSSAAKACQAC